MRGRGNWRRRAGRRVAGTSGAWGVSDASSLTGAAISINAQSRWTFGTVAHQVPTIAVSVPQIQRQSERLPGVSSPGSPTSMETDDIGPSGTELDPRRCPNFMAVRTTETVPPREFCHARGTSDGLGGPDSTTLHPNWGPQTSDMPGLRQQGIPNTETGWGLSISGRPPPSQRTLSGANNPF